MVIQSSPSQTVNPIACHYYAANQGNVVQSMQQDQTFLSYDPNEGTYGLLAFDQNKGGGQAQSNTLNGIEVWGVLHRWIMDPVVAGYKWAGSRQSAGYYEFRLGFRLGLVGNTYTYLLNGADLPTTTNAGTGINQTLDLRTRVPTIRGLWQVYVTGGRYGRSIPRRYGSVGAGTGERRSPWCGTGSALAW